MTLSSPVGSHGPTFGKLLARRARRLVTEEEGGLEGPVLHITAPNCRNEEKKSAARENHGLLIFCLSALRVAHAGHMRARTNALSFSSD